MTDRFEALERLARLRELNVLTPEEFAAEKARILSTDQPAATPMVEAAGLADEPDARKKWLPWAVGGGVAALAGAALAYSTMTEIKEFPERGSDKEAGANSTGEGKLEQGANADLGSLLKFDDPKTCQLGQKLRTLTSRMAAQQEGSGGGTVRMPDFSEPLKTSLGAADGDGNDEGATIVAVQAPGVWNGLKVTGVRTVSWSGSQVLSMQIRFSDSAEKVRRVLNAEGFTLPAVAELKDVGSGSAVLIGVENTSDGSALTCARMT